MKYDTSVEIERTLELSSIGTTTTYFPDLDLETQTMDLVASFRVAGSDAYACGVLFQFDSSEKGFKLQLQQAGPRLD
jgi:beta-fructofuranosidase